MSSKRNRFDPNHPLLKLENTAFSPHLGTSVQETRIRMAVTAAQDVIRVLNAESPVYPLFQNERLTGKNSLKKLFFQSLLFPHRPDRCGNSGCMRPLRLHAVSQLRRSINFVRERSHFAAIVLR